MRWGASEWFATSLESDSGVDANVRQAERIGSRLLCFEGGRLRRLGFPPLRGGAPLAPGRHGAPSARMCTPTAVDPDWTWRVVPDAQLQLQRTADLRTPGAWQNDGAAFTATNLLWKLDEPFAGEGAHFRRAIWVK